MAIEKKVTTERNQIQEIGETGETDPEITLSVKEFDLLYRQYKRAAYERIATLHQHKQTHLLSEFPD